MSAAHWLPSKGLLILVVLSLGNMGCRDVVVDLADRDGERVEQLADVSSPGKILAFLEDRYMLMEADNIPTDPQGYNENINFGQATQCYHSVNLTVPDGQFRIESTTGVLEGAPEVGDVGSCDHSTPRENFLFTTTTAAIENVVGNAGCFDATFDFGSFMQEGRGRISDDQQVLSLEIFFTGQAIGHRCADGGVGDPTIDLNGAPFTGDAVQAYDILLDAGDA